MNVPDYGLSLYVLKTFRINLTQYILPTLRNTYRLTCDPVWLPKSPVRHYSGICRTMTLHYFITELYAHRQSDDISDGVSIELRFLPQKQIFFLFFFYARTYFRSTIVKVQEL